MCRVLRLLRLSNTRKDALQNSFKTRFENEYTHARKHVHTRKHAHTHTLTHSLTHSLTLLRVYVSEKAQLGRKWRYRTHLLETGYRSRGKAGRTASDRPVWVWGGVGGCGGREVSVACVSVHM